MPTFRQSTWTLTPQMHGAKGAREPSVVKPPPMQLREIISVPKIRDPDDVALKPRFVRRITHNLSGRADGWVPPARARRWEARSLRSARR